jgi:hypothetical protein
MMGTRNLTVLSKCYLCWHNQEKRLERVVNRLFLSRGKRTPLTLDVSYNFAQSRYLWRSPVLTTLCVLWYSKESEKKSFSHEDDERRHTFLVWPFPPQLHRSQDDCTSHLVVGLTASSCDFIREISFLRKLQLFSFSWKMEYFGKRVCEYSVDRHLPFIFFLVLDSRTRVSFKRM